jgi:hypothetical protein
MIFSTPITKAKAAFCPVRFTAEEKKPLDYLFGFIGCAALLSDDTPHLYFGGRRSE